MAPTTTPAPAQTTTLGSWTPQAWIAWVADPLPSRPAVFDAGLLAAQAQVWAANYQGRQHS